MSDHLKKLNMPRTWKVNRKDNTFVIRPNPGKDMQLSMPLQVLLRDTLNVVSTAKEARFVINQKKVMINLKPAKMPEQPVGLFDVLSFADKHYRMIINERNHLVLKEITDADSKSLTTKILSKKSLKKGITQLGLLNGYSVLVKKDEYKVGDSVTLELPSLTVKDKKELKKGNNAFIFKGAHPSKEGKVEDIKEGIIIINTGKEKISTLVEYAIAQ